MRILAAILFAWALASPALAADGAKFRAIGFSADASHFAFEQYGIQDGSGFAYSEIFILDIAADAWAKGTPIRTLLEDETMDLRPVRAKAKKDSAAALAAAKIDTDPEVLASMPFTEIAADRTQLTFHDHFNNAMGMFGNADDQGSWSLRTAAIDVPLPPDCEPYIGVLGYTLHLKNNKTGTTTQLHADKSLPKSRGCAMGYDIEAVVQTVGAGGTGQLVAIIGVYSRGYEGADRRFIAVPFKAN